jgi:transketolase
MIPQHLQSLIKNNTVTLKPSPPLAEAPKVHIGDVTLSSPPAYKPGEMVATRLAYGVALKKLADTNMR